MNQAAASLLVAVALAGVTVVGDYFLKIAGSDSGIRWRPFIVGMVLYGASAFGWVYVLRHAKFAIVGAVFSVVVVVLMAGIGFFVFGESLTKTELIGLGCAVAALILLGGWA